MSGQNDNALLERKKYVRAFNDTMIKIWREQIALLGVVDTGALYRSTVAVGTSADGKYTFVSLSQRFNMYGLYADYGVGSNTPIRNAGALGRYNSRKRRKWFSRKYYASLMNLREFFADNLGKDLADTVSNALTRSLSRRFIT